MNKLNEKTIGQIAKLYNDTCAWNEDTGDNKNFNVYFQFSTKELFDKFRPDYESCEKIDELIDTWDNEDLSLSSHYFIDTTLLQPNKYEDDHKFCEEHKYEIETAIFEQFSLNDTNGAYRTYLKYREFIDRDSLRSELNMDDNEDSKQWFEECFPE